MPPPQGVQGLSLAFLLFDVVIGMHVFFDNIPLLYPVSFGEDTDQA